MCLEVGANLEKIHKGQDLFSSKRDCRGGVGCRWGSHQENALTPLPKCSFYFHNRTILIKGVQMSQST